MLNEFEKAIKFLSDLPTERAMKDVAKMRGVPESVKKVVETMALQKMDLVKGLRHMRLRERTLELLVHAANQRLAGYDALRDFIKNNDEFEVIINGKNDTPNS